MNNRINKILQEKKMQRVSWKDLAARLPIGSGGLRAAFSRGSVPDVYLVELEKFLKIGNGIVNGSINKSVSNDSIEDILFNRLLNRFEERFKELERKQKVIRKDFNMMFERQLKIDLLKKEEQKKKASGN